jgi:hypothetical protein
MRRPFRFAVLFVLVAAYASAQETTTGSLGGTVVDAQNAPLPGANVTINSPQGSKVFVTDATGKFFAPFLTPGKYSIKVELAGFTPLAQENIDVHLGKRIELSFTMKVGDVHEVIEVVGGAPVVDVASTTTGGTLSSDELKRLPVSRTFADTLYLVPGVSDSSGAGKSNPSIAGASGLDNAYIVDGVNITDEGFGGMGVYSYVYGSLGTNVTTDFIQETQVKTGGFEAEYGMATGGVVNVVTKSGTNAFHGAAFGYIQPSGTESGYKQLTTPNGTVNVQGSQSADFGVAVGGPLVKDKLFAFGVFDPQYANTTYTAPQGFTLASLGNVERKRDSYAYAGKLSYQLSPNHHFDLSAFGDPNNSPNGPQSAGALKGNSTEAFSSLDYGTHSQVLKYDGIIKPTWFIEATVSHSQNHFNETPSANTNQVTNGLVTPVLTTGGLGFYQDTDSHRFDYQLKSTNLFEAAGHHQLRYGVDYESMQYNVTGNYTGATFTLPDGTPSVSGAIVNITPDPTYGQIYVVTRAYIQARHETPQHYFAGFLQDTWQMGRLTIRPGLRYEQETLIGNPPLCHANDSNPGAADGSGPLIACQFAFNGNWAPRIGATYDLTGKGKTKLFASFSRFYVRIPNDLAARATSGDASVIFADYFDAGLTEPVPNGVLALGRTNHYLFSVSPETLIKGTGLTYQQEFNGGLEFEVGNATNLGVRYIHRNIPRVLEDAGNAPVAGYFLGVVPANFYYALTNIAPGSPVIPQLPGFPAGISEEGPVHDYNAVELTANKTFSQHWSMMASYRWSKLTGNFEGFFRSDNGQPDPGITSLFDFPINDPSYTSIGGPLGFGGDIRYQGCQYAGCGPLPNDRTHQIKAYGNYEINGLNLGLGINAQSGRSLTGFWANPAYTTPGEIPDNVRGSGIQTVDGFTTRTPFEFLVDAQVSYNFRVADGRHLILSADVFNLFNNQVAVAYDVNHDGGFGIPNPNFGQPVNGGNGNLTGFEVPRRIRFGVRFEW